MSQTAYSVDMGESFVGMKADSGFDDVISLQATEDILFGRGVVKNIGFDNQCRLPAANEGDLVFDADLVTSNTIDMDVNGTSITQVTFATDHATTMELIATELETFDDVLTAVVTTRTIVITSNDGEDIAVTSIVVAAGSSQANGAFTQGTRDTAIVGAALASHANEQALSTGIAKYVSTDPVSVMHQGRMWVYVDEAVTSDDDVYCRFLANGATKLPGMFRTDADSAKAFAISNARWVKGADAGGPALIEFRY